MTKFDPTSLYPQQSRDVVRLPRTGHFLLHKLTAVEAHPTLDKTTRQAADEIIFTFFKKKVFEKGCLGFHTRYTSLAFKSISTKGLKTIHFQSGAKALEEINAIAHREIMIDQRPHIVFVIMTDQGNDLIQAYDSGELTAEQLLEQVQLFRPELAEEETRAYV